MKLSKFIKELENLYPKYYAEEWDNIGLQIGNLNTEVKKVLTCLEITEDVIEEAIELKVDLIVSHHPIIFKPVKTLSQENGKSKLISLLIKNDIAVYAAHTNVDIAQYGMNDWVASVIGMRDTKILNITGSEKIAGKYYKYGIGRVGKIDNITLENLASDIKNKFGLQKVKVSGELDRNITKVAIVAGSGGEYFSIAKKHGCDCIITGDVTFHQAIDAMNENIAIIDAGHVIEIIFNDIMAEIINNFENIKCYASDIDVDPFEYI